MKEWNYKKTHRFEELVGFFVKAVCDSNFKAYVFGMKPLQLHSWLCRVVSKFQVREL